MLFVLPLLRYHEHGPEGLLERIKAFSRFMERFPGLSTVVLWHCKKRHLLVIMGDHLLVILDEHDDQSLQGRTADAKQEGAWWPSL